MEEDNFTRARLESRRASNYTHKTSKNNVARQFVDIYMNPDLQDSTDLQNVANMYLLLEEGIVPSSCTRKSEKISKRELNEIYVRIKQNATSNFIKFYQSYLRKIEQGYYPEYVESALEDVKTAYHTLRKSNLFDWNCPDEMITTSEMENLYLLISGQKKEGNMTEILK